MNGNNNQVRTKLILGRRLTLVVVGIALLLATGYIFVGIWFAKIQLEREFQQNAEIEAASLASLIIEAVMTDKLHKIPELLDGFHMANANLYYSFVCDSEGNPVAYTQPLQEGVPGDLQLLAKKHAESKGGRRHWFLQTEAGDIFHLVYPLEGRPGGYLHLGFTFKQVDSKLRVTARHLLSSMFLGLILSTIVGGLVYRRMAQPIKELTDAAVDFGAGDLARRVNQRPGEEDEVAILAEAFNRMADQLQEKVTELESSRSALADEKARIQAILDGMVHGVIFYEPNGLIGYLNSSARRHWGIEESDHRPSHEALHAGHPEALRAFKRVAMGIEASRHLRLRRGDRILDLFISAIRRRESGFLGMVEISSDVTEQVTSARALAHAEKLNVVGQLAAGVAHEINSPLDGAIEAARILERGEISKEEINELAGAQKMALERIAAIVCRLLTFSGKKSTRTGPISLWSVISDAVELIKYRLSKSKISIQLPSALEVPQVIEGEAIELSQVFVNLLSNAIDVSPEGSTIKIDVANNNGLVNISITDQGKGIAEGVDEKLFMPFFTTKEVGKGTGLGLAISKNIVEQFGGRIEVNNEEPPWGARFTVLLPWKGAKPEDHEPKDVSLGG
jgi:signal transduction histidine kinase